MPVSRLMVATTRTKRSHVRKRRRDVSRLPNATLVVIKNSRHGAVIDQPEAFNNVLLNFLNDE